MLESKLSENELYILIIPKKSNMGHFTEPKQFILGGPVKQSNIETSLQFCMTTYHCHQNEIEIVKLAMTKESFLETYKEGFGTYLHERQKEQFIHQNNNIVPSLSFICSRKIFKNNFITIFANKNFIATGPAREEVMERLADHIREKNGLTKKI